MFFQVLDAPELQDDFYLNLVDWSSQNMLSVGLNTCVYLWSACNSQVLDDRIFNFHLCVIFTPILCYVLHVNFFSGGETVRSEQ